MILLELTLDQSYLDFTAKFENADQQQTYELENKSKKSKSAKSKLAKTKIKEAEANKESELKNESIHDKSIENEEAEDDTESEEESDIPKTTNDDFIQSLQGEQLKLFNEIYTACLTNNKTKLNQTIADFANSNDEKTEVEKRSVLIESLLNKRLNKDNGFTLLHLTSQLGNSECIRELMLMGANPALGDLTRQSRLPYFLSANKQTRDQYRLFANDFPTRYDYVAAKINDPLSVEKLNERTQKDKEKKRKKNKLKKQREAQLKQKQTQEDMELNERKKFLELTDQEKKKLILDRNFLNLLPLDTKKSPTKESTSELKAPAPESPKYSIDDFKIISRCWFCGVNNSSHVPFEYFDYKFCSMKCLKSHREQQHQKTASNKK
jgi:hypothetical protein